MNLIGGQYNFICINSCDHYTQNIKSNLYKQAMRERHIIVFIIRKGKLRLGEFE